MNKEEKLEEEIQGIENNQEDEEKKEGQKDKLVSLALESAELFHDQFDNPFAHIKIEKSTGKRIEHIEGKFFKIWLGYLYYKQIGRVSSSEAIRSAINTLSGQARFKGGKYILHNRVAWHEEAIWYDLCDENWQAIKITSNGWEIVKDPPILFRRYSHQSPQVIPEEKNGDIEKLKKYINISENDSWILTKVWLVHALIPDSPHPIPVNYGDHGTGKSIKEKLSRRLVDPSELEVMDFPSKKDELIQTLAHHWFLPFDNVSQISDQISDSLCRAITGSGSSKRELYSNDEDVVYKFKRCISLNGINIVAQKPDLLDRCLLIELQRIPKENRCTEKELLEAFEKDRPNIFGGMLDALSHAMSLVKKINIKYKPRMADFAEWGEAIAQAMGYDENVFLKAYFRNIKSQYAEAIEAHLIGQTIVKLMEDKIEWTGNSTELLNELNKIATDSKINITDKAWPKAPNVLTRRINEIKTNLSEIGICATQDRTSIKRGWIIEKELEK